MEVLLIHASAGAGHQKAAEAVFQRVKNQPVLTGTLIDALDYTPSYFRRSYRDSYTYLVTRLPWIWDFFFKIADIPWLQGLVRVFRRCYNGVHTRRLVQLVQSKNWGAVVTTQFLSVEVCGFLKRSGRIQSRVVCVVTDYDVHRIWVNPGIDIYAVACEWTRARLLALGVAEERIKITGIPTDSRFAEVYDRAELRRKLGLDPAAFTVLMTTGSFGSGPIETLVKKLKNVQIIVVCGHNRKLFERLSPQAPAHVKVCGLVNNMYELMAASDCMLSKPGGLSISEALVMNLPMIFFSAIPGQETKNIEVLKHYQISDGLSTLDEVTQILERWQRSPDELEKIRQRMKTLARPRAAEDILALLSP